jgi:hypothetical protein
VRSRRDPDDRLAAAHRARRRGRSRASARGEVLSTPRAFATEVSPLFAERVAADD